MEWQFPKSVESKTGEDSILINGSAAHVQP